MCFFASQRWSKDRFVHSFVHCNGCKRADVMFCSTACLDTALLLYHRVLLLILLTSLSLDYTSFPSHPCLLCYASLHFSPFLPFIVSSFHFPSFHRFTLLPH